MELFVDLILMADSPGKEESLFGYDNNKDLKICFLVTRISCHAHELSHAKADLKVFVTVIPKEGLARTSPAKPSCG